MECGHDLNVGCTRPKYRASCLKYSFRHTEQSVLGVVSQSNDDIWLYLLDVPIELNDACHKDGRGFPTLEEERVLISLYLLLRGVREVDFRPLDVRPLEELVEFLTRVSDEGAPLLDFLVGRRFPDDDDFGVSRPESFNHW